MDLAQAYKEIWTKKLQGIQEPHKQSIDRVRWTGSLFTSGDSGPLMDFGTGSGAMLAEASRNGWQAMGTDIDPALVEWLTKSGYFVHLVDLNQRTPFAPDHFGVVTSCDVIEHLIDPDNMLREAYRILKPTGRAFIATPNCSSWRRVKSLAAGKMFRTSGDDYLRDGGHLAYYGPLDLKESLERAGFKAVEIKFFNQDPILPEQALALSSIGGRQEWLEHTYMIAVGTK